MFGDARSRLQVRPDHFGPLKDDRKSWQVVAACSFGGAAPPTPVTISN